MGDSRSRVAIVTGATGGLGRAMCHALARDGYKVVGADLPGALAPDASDWDGVEMDVRDVASIRASVRQVVERHGRLDVMVCNAGVNVRRPSLDVTEADWDTVLGVNLRGVFFCAQAAAAAMVERGGGGKIVTIASIYGLVGVGVAMAGFPGGAAYSASKGGVVNLTRTLAIEWAPHNIQVNAVAPTYVHTPLTERLVSDAAFLRAILERTPGGRLATPEAVADAVAFLASPRADHITGVTLPVDGGWTAH